MTRHSKYSGVDPIPNIPFPLFLQNVFIEHLLMPSIKDGVVNMTDKVFASVELILLQNYIFWVGEYGHLSLAPLKLLQQEFRLSYFSVVSPSF